MLSEHFFVELWDGGGRRARRPGNRKVPRSIERGYLSTNIKGGLRISPSIILGVMGLSPSSHLPGDGSVNGVTSDAIFCTPFFLPRPSSFTNHISHQ